MKPITQTACFELVCRFCDKFMGDIAIPFDDPQEGFKKAKDIQDHLIELKSFPVCDVCSATIGNKMGPTVRGKDLG